MAANEPAPMAERGGDTQAAPSPASFPAPARELRAQSVHRLQVGLFGLSAMLLIVGLANIIMDRARLNESKDPIEKVIAADAPPKKPAVDPLADIGVVPSADPAPDAPADPAPVPDAAAVAPAPPAANYPAAPGP